VTLGADPPSKAAVAPASVLGRLRSLRGTAARPRATAAITNQTVFTTVDGHASWTRPFRASAAPAPRFIAASVLGVTRTERLLLRANAASTRTAPAKPIRSMRFMAPILPARVSREK